jgi:hypothetical protein
VAGGASVEVVGQEELKVDPASLLDLLGRRVGSRERVVSSDPLRVVGEVDADCDTKVFRLVDREGFLLAASCSRPINPARCT